VIAARIIIKRGTSEKRYTQQDGDPVMWDVEFKDDRGRWKRSIPVTGQRVLWDVALHVQRDVLVFEEDL
jgi:hypothetical protein